MGNKNAKVLPEPVSDSKTTSLSVLNASSDAICISFNAFICKLANASSMEKEVIFIQQKYINSRGCFFSLIKPLQQPLLGIKKTELKGISSAIQ
jgi:hypothetical protein